MLGWMDRCVPTPGHRPSRWDGHAGLWRPLPGRRQTHSAKAASTTPTLSTWPHCPPPFTRPGHPALCLEDQLALKVTPQPDSWCGSEGPAASRQNPGWNETPEQSSPVLPSFHHPLRGAGGFLASPAPPPPRNCLGFQTSFSSEGRNTLPWVSSFLLI